MANIPCPIPCIACPAPVPGTDGLGLAPQDPSNPFVNLSSERPDIDLFIGRKYGGELPPLGSTWYAVGCVAWCLSTESQADADICAQNQEVFCQSSNWPQPNPNPGGPALVNRTVYYNDAQSCGFICPDGNTFTFTVPAGVFAQFSKAAANALAASYACNRATANRLCFGSMTNSRCCLNGTMAAGIAVASSNFPISFDIVSGSVPPGTIIVQNSVVSVVITGTPTQAGDYPIRIRATDRFGNTMEKNFTVSVFGLITASQLPDATVGDQYAAQLNYSGTAAGPVTLSIVGGALPNGIFMDSAGLFSGNPTEEGAFQITVNLTDGVMSCDKVFDIFSTSDCTAFDGSAVTYWAGFPEVQVGSGLSYTVLEADMEDGDRFHVHIAAVCEVNVHIEVSWGNTFSWGFGGGIAGPPDGGYDLLIAANTPLILAGIADGPNGDCTITITIVP